MNDKILLAIGFFAGEGEDLQNRRAILERCIVSARASGADQLVIFVTGNAAAVRTWPELHGVLVFDVGENPGGPIGDMKIVWAAINEANRRSCGFLVKIGGDVFHPRPGWARKMVARLGSDGVLFSGICDAQCIPTRVFCARMDFLVRAWPGPESVERHSCLERMFTANLHKLGLEECWITVPCHQLHEAGTCWVRPDDPDFAYLHTHIAAKAAEWKMEAQ